MICNSKMLPKEVIIVISGSNYKGKTRYYTYCDFILSILYRKGKKNSASNKNYGSKFSECNYISFFDADDIMSIKRIETLYYIINHYYQFDIILHMYTKNYKQLNNISYNKDITNYFYLNSSYITYLYRSKIGHYKTKLWGCCHFLPKQYHISNGWITIKKSMFIKQKFNEDILFQREEDSEYNGRVIAKGYKALILTLILGYYSKQNKCNVISNIT